LKNRSQDLAEYLNPQFAFNCKNFRSMDAFLCWLFL